nr:small hydrophobic protein [Avian metapneumovirus]UWK23272.1 small hydrophobic protein [Avian metapneumovirus]UWK23281.1 small hydrophobic protein [Avian metapneumovirus]UWK23290.1 small hydrophobic protein [Avian metapneumovirus]UYX79518.1 small hydrophobic protein [Avian metapneumovirus]
MTSTVNLGSDTASKWKVIKSRCNSCCRILVSCAAVICAILALIFLVATIGLSVKLAFTVQEIHNCKQKLSGASTTTAAIYTTPSTMIEALQTNQLKLTTNEGRSTLPDCLVEKKLCEGEVRYLKTKGCLGAREGEDLNCIDLVVECVGKPCGHNEDYKECICTNNGTATKCCYI